MLEWLFCRASSGRGVPQAKSHGFCQSLSCARRDKQEEFLGGGNQALDVCVLPRACWLTHTPYAIVWGEVKVIDFLLPIKIDWPRIYLRNYKRFFVRGFPRGS